jgi:hypothetical protein
MRNLPLILGTFVVAASSGAQTNLTADDIIARYVKTVGGADLAAVNTELGAKNLQPIVLITRKDWEGVGKGGQ